MGFYTRQADELRRRGRARAAYARFIARYLNRRALLRLAWAIARAAAVRFGGGAGSFIAGSMRQAWEERRRHLTATA